MNRRRTRAQEPRPDDLVTSLAVALCMGAEDPVRGAGFAAAVLVDLIQALDVSKEADHEDPGIR